MLTIGFITVAAAVAVVIYRAVYQNSINKRLNNGEIRHHRMPSPFTFTLVAVITALVAAVAVTAFMPSSGDVIIPDEYRNAVFDAEGYNPNEMTGYRTAYSIDGNPGYTKQVEQKGDVRFTCFVREDDFDLYHPSFIVFAEYTGDKNILYTGYNIQNSIPSGERLGGHGAAGHPFGGYLCFVGTSNVSFSVELTSYFYDSPLKDENMGDYATASGTVTIFTP